MEVCLGATGKCRRCDADEVLTTVAGVRSELTQMQEREVFKWRRGYKRSSRETVISTTMSHKAKRDKAQPRIVIPECADAMRVSEHCASTPSARAKRLMINRTMSKCRTRQPESCDALSAFLHDWLERGVDRTSERSQIERWPVLAAGESASTTQSRSERKVVVRKHT